MFRLATGLAAIAAVAGGCIFFDDRHPHPDPGPGASCANLQTQFAATVVDLGTCQVDTDCQIVGGKVEQTCDCAAYLGGYGDGVGIARNAPKLSQAIAIEQQYTAQCNDISQCGDPGVDCVCDSAPPQGVVCSNHRCVVIPGDSCFGYPDAGDPPPPDAYIPPDAYYPDAP